MYMFPDASYTTFVGYLSLDIVARMSSPLKERVYEGERDNVCVCVCV